MSTADVIHVPYRCPDCGNSIKFETLKELRLHLQIEHGDRHTNTWKEKRQPHLSSKMFSSRSSTPILEMFHADAIRIEDDLLTHKRNELNNKHRRMNSRNSNNASGFSRSTIRQVDGRTDLGPALFRQYGHSSRVEHKYSNKSRAERGPKFNGHEHSNRVLTSFSDRYLDDSFRDDESLQDVTHPIKIPRDINKIHNVSSSEKKTSSDTNTGLPESVSTDMDSHVRQTLTALSQEVVVSRANQHATADSLKATQDVYSSLEQSAQERISKQQEIITSLALKLSEKDEKLANLTVQVNSLKSQSAEEEAKNLFYIKSSQESEKLLQEELSLKQKELVSLTKRVENAKLAVLKCEKEIKDKTEEPIVNAKDKTDYHTNFDKTDIPEKETSKELNTGNINLRRLSDGKELKEGIHHDKEHLPFQVNQARIVEKGMLAKEKELVSLRSKSMQLESDRQTLLLEMQALLEIAATDNEKLRSELANQGKQLSKLNLELERSKQEQSELLGETNTLYFQADLSLSRLKHVLEERDSQLSSVSAQLEQAREMQGRLTNERQEYLKAAMEKETHYQAMVQENALQLKIMKESLDESQVEKEKLQEKLKDLKKELTRKEREDLQMEERTREMETQLSEHEAWQVSLREQIKNKEERLHKAKKSMDEMNSFMSDTAKRELEARARLEQFISNLIDRSTQTESELKTLKEAYAAKEKALKKITEAQAHAPSKSNSMYDGRDEENVQFHPSWQKETREELKKLSAPSLQKERSYQLSDQNSLDHVNPHSSSSRHPLFGQPDFITEGDDESQEPIRLRSTINRVKKKESMAVVPERQLKNRPLLVLGKEYPHPSAYGLNKAQNTKPKASMVNGHSSDDQENYFPEDGRRPTRVSLYEDKYYLPAESDEYSLRPTLDPKPEGQTKAGTKRSYLGSSPLKSHNHQHRNKDPSYSMLNNSPLFTNTPDVERMYQNVQKHSYATNPVNQLSKRNPLNEEPYARGERLEQLPMDEHGIIWGPYDRSSSRVKPQKKKVRRRSNHKLGKRENGNKNLYTDGHHSDSEGCIDSDEDIPTLQTKDGQGKQSAYPFLESPAPLGDKIAFLLTSMAPGTASSSARRQYAENAKARPNNEEDVKFTYSASESDSQHDSSPILSARAVQERVEKLTAAKNKERTSSPIPKARNKALHLVQHNDHDTHTPPSTQADEAEQSQTMLDFYPDQETTYSPIDNDQLKDDKSNSDTMPTVIERQVDKYNTDEKMDNNEPMMNTSEHPYAETEIFQDQQMIEPEQSEPVKMTSSNDEMDGPMHLLNPYADHNEQLESHNAESDFSSSSYATLRTDPQRLTDNLDYTVDTQEEDETIRPDKEQNVFAQVHAELKDDYIDEEFRSPPVSEVREKFRRMSSRESFTRSKSSDSRRTSLQRQDSVVKSTSYDMVMKELIQKHPYLNNGPQDIESSSASTENIFMSVEKRLDDNTVNKESIIEGVAAVPTQSLLEKNDSTDPGHLSSDDEDYNAMPKRQDTPSRRMSRVETIDASTDTDLEKLAMPGSSQKPIAGKKKKKNGTWMKKEKNKKQKATVKLKDVAKNNWTSVDNNDPEEAEREERLAKRRIRVALFCALAYSDTQSLLSASQVCRDWRKIAHHPSLWKDVELRDAQVSSQFLITMSQWCTQTQTISLQGLKGRSQKLMESEDDFNKTTRGSLESGLERLLFACQGSLKSLSIEGCENILTDKCLWLVSSNCRMLTHLSYRSRLDPINPQLMWALGGGCPGITSLYVHPYSDSTSQNAMTNKCLLQISQFYRDLQQVGLGGMEINMAGILPLIQSCQHLTSIHMDSCIALTDDLATAMCRAGLKDLHTFTITGTAFQAKAILTLHANCRLLKRIHATVTSQSCGLDLQKRKERNEYSKLIKGYKDLKKKAGLSNILTLDIQEPE